MRMMWVALVAAAGLLPQAQAGAPINTMCPVKPKQKSRPTITVVYEGQVIGFC